jgi:hypothetical protein
VGRPLHASTLRRSLPLFRVGAQRRRYFPRRSFANLRFAFQSA